MKEDINILDELNKGACMGVNAITFTIEKVKDETLRKELIQECMNYQKIIDKIKVIYPEYCVKKPHETSKMNKIMTMWGINMNTIKDDSSSKIAEMMLQGVNMGIIEGRKLLNHKNTDEEVEKLINEYIKMQEKAVEALKKFL